MVAPAYTEGLHRQEVNLCPDSEQTDTVDVGSKKRAVQQVVSDLQAALPINVATIPRRSNPVVIHIHAQK